MTRLNMKKRFSIVLSILVLFSLSIKISVFAEENAKVMFANTIDDTVKLYVRGAEPSSENVKFQIRNIPTDQPVKVYPISDDSVPMRTLILLDNSKSFSDKNQPKLKETLHSIIDSHAEKELFMIATFDEELHTLADNYSDDYTLLNKVIDGITFQSQYTKLMQILKEVVDNLNSEEYNGFTRIIIFSDGDNHKDTDGISVDSLKEDIKNSAYPVYTFGLKSNDKNAQENIDKLFDLSRAVGIEGRDFEKLDASQIAAITAMDNDMAVFEAVIPLDAQIGEMQESLLTLSDGTQLKVRIETPFSTKVADQDDPAPVVESVKEPDKKAEPAPSPTPKPEEPKTPVKKGLPIWIWIIGITVILALAGGLAFFLVSRSKKKKNIPVAPTGRDYTPTENLSSLEYQKTVYLDDERSNHRDTVQLTPEDGQSMVKRYRISLTDSSDDLRSFRCELTDAINIGRRPENNLVISDDNSVHGNHCRISVKNGVFYITDLKDVKNHTSVNGVAIKPEIPQLIVSNSTITLGRHSYVVNITEV